MRKREREIPAAFTLISEWLGEEGGNDETRLQHGVSRTGAIITNILFRWVERTGLIFISIYPLVFVLFCFINFEATLKWKRIDAGCQAHERLVSKGHSIYWMVNCVKFKWALALHDASFPAISSVPFRSLCHLWVPLSPSPLSRFSSSLYSFHFIMISSTQLKWCGTAVAMSKLLPLRTAGQREQRTEMQKSVLVRSCEVGHMNAFSNFFFLFFGSVISFFFCSFAAFIFRLVRLHVNP